MGMIRFILISISMVGICLVLAFLLVRRRQTLIAFLIGLLVFGGYQLYLHRALNLSIQACIDRACLSGGLPPNCPEAQFGCTEWSGLSAFLFYITGIVQTALFLIGTGILAIFAASRRRARSPAAFDPGGQPL